jgi:hypothetical protein
MPANILLELLGIEDKSFMKYADDLLNEVALGADEKPIMAELKLKLSGFDVHALNAFKKQLAYYQDDDSIPPFAMTEEGKLRFKNALDLLQEQVHQRELELIIDEIAQKRANKSSDQLLKPSNEPVLKASENSKLWGFFLSFLPKKNPEADNPIEPPEKPKPEP